MNGQFIACIMDVYDKVFSDVELADLAKNLQVFSEIKFFEEDAKLVGSLDNQLDYVGRRLSTNQSS